MPRLPVSMLHQTEGSRLPGVTGISVNALEVQTRCSVLRSDIRNKYLTMTLPSPRRKLACVILTVPAFLVPLLTCLS